MKSMCMDVNSLANPWMIAVIQIVLSNISSVHIETLYASI